MMNIDTGKLKKSFLKAFFIIAYAGIIGVYGVLGANALQTILPNFSFVLLAVAGALILLRLDYLFTGPAFCLERKFVKYFSRPSRVKTEQTKPTEENVTETKE